MMLKACSKHLFAEPRLTLTPLLAHHARWDCPVCDRFLGWEAKPENADKKRRKPQDHLFWIFEGRGVDYCQLCLGHKEELPPKTVFQVHHIVEVQAGGSDEPENLMHLCSICHRLLHVLRLYRQVPENMAEELAPDSEAVPW